MSLTRLKKLDLETREKLTDAPGPADECLCATLAPLYEKPEGPKTFDNMRKSIKKVIRTVSGSVKRNIYAAHGGPTEMVIPISGAAGKKGGLQTEKEVVKKKGSCGKCPCGKKDFVMKHTHATIRIIAPDLSSICDCPTDCLPNKARELTDNIKVTIERVETEPTHPGIDKVERGRSMPIEREDSTEENPATELPEAQLLKEQWGVGLNQIELEETGSTVLEE